MDYDDTVIFRVAQLMCSEPAASKAQIARQVNEELRPHNKLTREKLYHCFAKAVTKGFVRIVQPPQVDLANRIESRYHLPQHSVHVVPATLHNADLLPAAMASRAAELIRLLSSSQKRPVGLGLGAGRSTRDFCRFLSTELQAQRPVQRLKLIAISAGCSSRAPEFAPVSFFNLFPDDLIHSRVGLFAEPLVTNAEFETIRKRPWIQEAFKARNEVDLVITSMGTMDDEHDHLRQFLEESGTAGSTLVKEGWVGNVQYRPFTEDGAVLGKPEDWRAVTLFELEELKSLACMKNKHVLLLGQPCRLCELTKARALRALFRPQMRVFTEVFIDLPTATELLDNQESQ